jgi:cysteine desulfurase
VGILFINEEIKIHPMLNGGAQERNMRAGTENLYGIVGYAKALELAMQKQQEDSDYVRGLKDYMAQRVTESFPGATINGENGSKALYTVLNISFPKTDKSEMLLFNLDMAGICVSGGSACSSGANSISHVIKALYNGRSENMVPIRFSFSKQNTREEIDTVIEKLKELV